MTASEIVEWAQAKHDAGAGHDGDCGRELAPGVTWRCAEHRRQPQPFETRMR